MKKLFLIILITCLTCLEATAQEKQPKLNISLGVSPPIKVDGMGKFFNEDWILDHSQDPGISPYDRKYFKINNLITFDYVIKQKLFLRLSGGVTIRKITEKMQSDTTFVNPPLAPMDIVFKQHLNYTQLNWNVSFGAGYRITGEKFSPYFGCELLFMRYGKGKQKGDYYYYAYDHSNPPPGITNENTYTMTIPDGYGSGLGVFAGIDYSLSKSFLLSFEVSEYYMGVFFNGKTATHTIGSDAGVEYDTWGYQKDTFRQFSFSNFVPSIKIKYSF